jgi:hypothetical protein
VDELTSLATDAQLLRRQIEQNLSTDYADYTDYEEHSDYTEGDS